jgi:hypothetical protein
MDSQQHMDIHDSYVAGFVNNQDDSHVVVAAMHAQQQTMVTTAVHQHQQLQNQASGAAPVGSEKRAPRMRFSQEASDRLYALYNSKMAWICRMKIPL